MKTESCAFVILGITGDLAARKLIPALFELHRQGELHPDTRIIGFARSELTDAELRERLRGSLQKFANGFSEDAWQQLAGRISYLRGAYDDVDSFTALTGELDRLGLSRRVFYTSTPPSTYAGIINALSEAGLNRPPAGGWSRIVIEKPFGTDLDSARELNRVLSDSFSEEQIYRIDHYLGKETAQNIAALRFANALFEPTWNNRYIDHVQVTMEETVGMEGRGSFYEEAGVLRDVFQNHLLQLVALIAMEPPARYDARSVRNEKVKVFEALSCVHPQRAVFGQYTAADGRAGYRQEEGVSPDSQQATYAAVELAIANWRWQGVPFFVRSGKALASKSTEVVLQYRVPPHVPFSIDQELRADRLVLRVSPDEGISIRFNVKKPGQDIRMDRARLDFSYSREFSVPNPDAYETLLLDVIQGDATLFMRADEVEAQWRIMEPLLEAAETAGQPAEYPAGSNGPAAAWALLEDQGRYWHRPGG